jgi:hypothetical protein
MLASAFRGRSAPPDDDDAVGGMVDWRWDSSASSVAGDAMVLGAQDLGLLGDLETNEHHGARVLEDLRQRLTLPQSSPDAVRISALVHLGPAHLGVEAAQSVPLTVHDVCTRVICDGGGDQPLRAMKHRVDANHGTAVGADGVRRYNGAAVNTAPPSCSIALCFKPEHPVFIFHGFEGFAPPEDNATSSSSSSRPSVYSSVDLVLNSSAFARATPNLVLHRVRRLLSVGAGGRRTAKLASADAVATAKVRVPAPPELARLGRTVWDDADYFVEYQAQEAAAQDNGGGCVQTAAATMQRRTRRPAGVSVLSSITMIHDLDELYEKCVPPRARSLLLRALPPRALCSDAELLAALERRFQPFVRQGAPLLVGARVKLRRSGAWVPATVIDVPDHAPSGGAGYTLRFGGAGEGAQTQVASRVPPSEVQALTRIELVEVPSDSPLLELADEPADGGGPNLAAEQAACEVERAAAAAAGTEWEPPRTRRIAFATFALASDAKRACTAADRQALPGLTLRRPEPPKSKQERKQARADAKAEAKRAAGRGGELAQDIVLLDDNEVYHRGGEVASQERAAREKESERARRGRIVRYGVRATPVEQMPVPTRSMTVSAAEAGAAIGAVTLASSHPAPLGVGGSAVTEVAWREAAGEAARTMWEAGSQVNGAATAAAAAAAAVLRKMGYGRSLLISAFSSFYFLTTPPQRVSLSLLYFLYLLSCRYEDSECALAASQAAMSVSASGLAWNAHDPNRRPPPQVIGHELLRCPPTPAPPRLPIAPDVARETLSAAVLSAGAHRPAGGSAAEAAAQQQQQQQQQPSAKEQATRRAAEEKRRLANATAAVTVHSVTVEWDTPPATMHHATTMDAIAVRYRPVGLDSEPYQSTVVDLEEQQRAERPNSIMVTGLEIGTAYEFVLATKNAFGWSPDSNALEVCTKDSWQDNESFL